MDFTKITRIAGVASACLILALAMTSCDGGGNGKEDPTPLECGSRSAQPTNELSQADLFEKEFQQVLNTTYNSVSIVNAMEACRAVCNILDGVARLPNDESMPILERFLDMSLCASLDPIVDFPSTYGSARHVFWEREKWFEKMFYVVRQTFYASIQTREDPFKDWNKFFALFGKFTNEFAMVDRCQPTQSGPKREYMLELKDNFNTYVHQVRDIDIKHHKSKPTDLQKAEIIRRFEELEHYVETLVPPRNLLDEQRRAAEERKEHRLKYKKNAPQKSDKPDSKRYPEFPYTM